MNSLIRAITARQENLLETIRVAKKALQGSPEGRLRLNVKQGWTDYYHICDVERKGGIYIPKKKISLAKSLAQKNYLERLIRSAEEELSVLDRFLKSYGDYRPEDVYTKLSPARKKLVVPYLLDDEEYVRRWKEIKYEPNPFRREECIYETKQGDMVRSKSEAIIADIYYDLDIPYKYEFPVKLHDGTTKYVDFMALHVRKRERYYHEHLGLLDDPFYRKINMKKLDEYKRSGIFVGKNLILSHETEESPLDIRQMRKVLKEIFLS